MDRTTEHFNFEKPTESDFYKIKTYTDNLDLIDAQLYENNSLTDALINSVGDHFSDTGNPHNVTCDQIGAAFILHNHDTRYATISALSDKANIDRPIFKNNIAIHDLTSASKYFNISFLNNYNTIRFQNGLVTGTSIELGDIETESSDVIKITFIPSGSPSTSYKIYGEHNITTTSTIPSSFIGEGNIAFCTSNSRIYRGINGANVAF